MKLTRRGFLRFGGQALAAGGLYTACGNLPRALAATDTSGYKALVCLYLNGGNDSFNMLVPRAPDAYATYARSRGALAVPADALLPITDADQQLDMGLHPSCAGLADLFRDGRLAFIANVGSLVRPVTRDELLAGARTPPKLFSHYDQQLQWMTGTASNRQRGWGGRVADRLAIELGDPLVSYSISMSGANTWQSGVRTTACVLGANGVPGFALTSGTGTWPNRRRYTLQRILGDAAQDPNLMVQRMEQIVDSTEDAALVVSAALQLAPAISTPFPSTSLGTNLRNVARLIAVHNEIGHSRQMFMVDCPGFDTHNGQLAAHPGLLSSLSAAVKAFQSALAELGLADQVTTFSASEFGRTLTSNGDGTDHGWGGHQFVLGGAVRGGRIYGRVPDLTIDGPDDSGFGRMIPTTSVEQMAATLARWFGVDEADLDAIFPNLVNFASRDVGFFA